VGPELCNHQPGNIPRQKLVVTRKTRSTTGCYARMQQAITNCIGLRFTHLTEVICEGSPHLQELVLTLNHKAREPSRANVSLCPLDDLRIMLPAMVPLQAAERDWRCMTCVNAKTSHAMTYLNIVRSGGLTRHCCDDFGARLRTQQTHVFAID